LIFINIYQDSHDNLFIYDLEDSFIYSTMAQEVQFLKKGYAEKGQWPAPYY
jgi:hypothetical protein